jgi:CheY-like chemotaxis protein
MSLPPSSPSDAPGTPAADEVRVLVVDDFPDAAATLAGLLEADGYQVRIAHSGDEALAIVEAQPPHCVILDINMPGLDGDGLSARLRERYGDDIVLIAVTGTGRDDRRVAETFARVDHYLVKPLDPAALRKALPPLGR